MGSGSRGILGWVVAAAATGGVAFGLGALGMFAPPDAVDAAVSVVGSVPAGPPAYDCPGGDQVARFPPGAQLYLTGRDAGTTWLLTRSPTSGYESVWVRADAVHVDESLGRFEELEVISCDSVVIVRRGGDPAG